MANHEIVRIITDILEIRVINDMISDFREELLNRRMYRRECLSKMDDIISYLRKISVNTRQKRRGRRSIWRKE